MTSLLASLGRFLHRRCRIVVGLWVLVVLLGGVLGGAVFDNAAQPGLRAGAESTRVDGIVDRFDPRGEDVLVVVGGAPMLSRETIDRAMTVLYELREVPGVAQVRDPYTTANADLFGDDGQGVVVEVELDHDLSTAEAEDAADRVAAAARSLPFATVLVGGELVSDRAFAEQAVSDAARGEGVALVLVAILLVTVLGGWLVGLTPVLTGLAAVSASLLGLSGLAAVSEVSEYAVNVVTVLGLGLCLDYSLLVLARYRDELAAAGRRADPAELMATALATSGRTVLVSGATVGASLAALLLLGDPLLGGLATGGLVAILTATAAGLTLTPAIIAAAGRHVPPTGHGRFARPGRPPRVALLDRLVVVAQARPLMTMLASSAILLVLAAPLLALSVGNSDARALPEGSEPRLAYELLEADHPDLATAPITVLYRAAGPDDLTGFVERLNELPGVEQVAPLDELPDGDARILVQPDGTSTGERAQSVVRTLRGLDVPGRVQVGGPAAELVDDKQAARDRLPIAALAVSSMTVGLLLWLTRAPVVALKTLVLNLLSLAATLGVVVAVFQWGWGSSWLGFTPTGTIDIVTPLLLFMFVFGLSMDYHVFLVARIKEAWDGRRPGADAGEASDLAVRDGVAAAGRVVTLGGLAIGLVFLGFATGKLVAVKEIGVGMSVGILLDVTVVRGLLLPSAMSLLGGLNWRAPRWLSRA